MRNKTHGSIRALIYAINIGFLCFLTTNDAICQTFDSDTEIQVRLDDRSSKDARLQYRIRNSFSYKFTDDDNWYFKTYITTGDSFEGTQNTLTPISEHEFNIRRAFFEHKNQYSLFQIGTIPTFKGRVSSSGLSKDGFIQGVRAVYNSNEYAQIEFVFGSIKELNASNAIEFPASLDYLEFEVSMEFSPLSSMEFSIERMTGLNFVRSEYRRQLDSGEEISIELVNTLGQRDSKFVVGLSGGLQLLNRDADYFAYYSFVSNNIGDRASLTEDFIDTGHGISFELETRLEQNPSVKAFFRVDLYNDESRGIIGFKAKL